MLSILILSSKLRELISNFDRFVKAYAPLRAQNSLEEFSGNHQHTTIENIVEPLLRNMQIREIRPIERKILTMDDFEPSSRLYLNNPCQSNYELSSRRLFDLERIYSLLSGSSKFPFGQFAFSEHFVEFYRAFFRTPYEILVNKQDKIELSML